MSGADTSTGVMAGLDAARRAASWETARQVRGLHRRFGAAGWLALAALVGTLAGWQALQFEQGELERLRAEAQARPKQVRPVAPPRDEGREQLKAFYDRLPAQEDIPTAVQDLVNGAEALGLSLPSGEYRPETDVAGGFFRYRITLPVKGNVRSVYQFVQQSLKRQPTMALESMAFKRARVESTEVEARIQFVLLTKVTGSPLDGGVAR